MTLDRIKPQNTRVLVLLPPDTERTSESGLILADAIPPALSYGRVLRVGPQVREIHEGDMVAFPPEVGDPIPLTDAHHGLFVRESEIALVIPKRQPQGAA